MYETHYVPNIDGGLNYGHPAEIADNEWTNSDSFEPRDGCALQMTALVQTDSSWYTIDAANEQVIGIVPLCAASPMMLAATIDTNSGNVVSLYEVESNGNVIGGSSVTIAGSLGVNPASSARGHFTECMIAGQQLLACGTAGGDTIIRLFGYAPGVINAAVVNPSSPTNFAAQFVTPLASHAAVCGDFTATAIAGRTVNISDANDITAAGWVPAIGNSADEITLDSSGRITGAVPTSDGGLILTTHDTYYFRSTGGQDPPFSISRIGQGTPATARQWAVNTPFGPIIMFTNHIGDMNGSPVPGAEKCFRYYLTPTATAFGTAQGYFKWVWDSRRSAVIMARPNYGASSAPFTSERMYFQPNGGRWWRASFTPQGVFDHCTAHGADPSHGVMTSVYAAIEMNGNLHLETTTSVEATDTAGSNSAFLDTKDFHFANPSRSDYIAWIEVDWEPLTTNALLQVWSIAREQLFPTSFFASNPGTPPLPSGPDYTFEGELAEGEQRVPIRRRGKYVRFSFNSSINGRVRIRGFRIRWERGSDR